MLNMYNQIDEKLINCLNSKVSNIDQSRDLLPGIMSGVEKGKYHSYDFTKYAAAAVLAIVITFSAFAGLFPSTAARAVDTIKTVFMMDKDHNIVEKKSYKAFMSPGLSKTTALSDEELSKKLGVNVKFPEALAQDYKINSKADAVALAKDLDYATFEKISLDLAASISNEEVFNSLKQYGPRRSIGAIYKDSSGNTACIAVTAGVVNIQDKYIDSSAEVQDLTINGQSAKWIPLIYPNYENEDVTREPIGLIKEAILYWNVGNTTYVVEPLKGQQLPLDTAINVARDFISAQVN